VPSAEVDGKLYTSGDEILVALEVLAGKLGGVSLTDPKMQKINELERGMLAGWWGLLAYDCEDRDEEQEVIEIYKKALCKIEN
jgi:glutathione S-transferase